jgi:FeS assembly protein IscX
MSDLTWDASYAVALALIEAHPDLNVEEIGYEQLFELVIALPNFVDDPELANEGLLDCIIREWYEEVSNA